MPERTFAQRMVRTSEAETPVVNRKVRINLFCATYEKRARRHAFRRWRREKDTRTLSGHLYPQRLAAQDNPAMWPRNVSRKKDTHARQPREAGKAVAR